MRIYGLYVTAFLFGATATLSSAISYAAGPDACSPQIEQKIARAVSAQSYNDALAEVDSLESDAIGRFGKASRCYGVALAERAAIFQLLDRNVEATPILEKAIELLRSTTDPSDSRLLLALNNYGVNLFVLRRYKEAARVHEEVLDLRRKLEPPDSAATAESLHNLADAYRYISPTDERVKRLYEDALALKGSLDRPDQVSMAQTRQNLASMQENLGQLNDASSNLELALRAYRKNLTADDIRVASVLNRQGNLFFRQGDYATAERKFDEAVKLERASKKIQAKTLAATLDDFAANEIQLGKLTHANALAQEALAIRRRVFSDEHPTIARTLSNLSYIAWLTRKYNEALTFARESSQITNTATTIDIAGKFRLQRHLLILWSKFSESAADPFSQSAAEEAFLIGQQAMRSDTAATLARTAERFSDREPHLRDLLKQVDDIDRVASALEQNIPHSFSLNSTAEEDKFSRIRIEMSALAHKRRIALAEIENTFPDYARLVAPKPMAGASVQKLLQPNEALVAYLVGLQDVFLWCITREAFTFRRLEISPQQLKRAVDVLRSSLDRDPESDRNATLFDLGLANDLYNQLLGPVASQLKSKSKLIVVPSGPLIGLPLHLLVASRPKILQPTRGQPDSYKAADWVIRKFAVTEIPAVESLERLRRPTAPMVQRKPMIGFANPLPNPTFQQQAGADNALTPSAKIRGGKIRRGLPANIRGANDIAALRQFLAKEPLPDSESELREVASIVGAADEDLFVGARATESSLKTANLESYRLIYFATHGQVANRFGESEPSLALTVPDNPNEFDDGLLTASEIAQLKLNADWVVLSACDTASGESGNAEGLSGLARAFFHAGARALLVSNWSLDDISAREIMKATFTALQLGRASTKGQALQQAMVAQINAAGGGQKSWDAYPGRWAAFEIVGSE